MKHSRGQTLLILGVALVSAAQAYCLLTSRARYRKALNGLSAANHALNHDDLTGALSRHAGMKALDRVAVEARNPGKSYATLIVDVDDFKHINDKYGHAVGDLALQTLADRFRERLRETDTLARFGGDEFLIILSGMHNAQEMEQISAALQETASMPMLVPHTLLSGSIVGTNGNRLPSNMPPISVPLTISIGAAFTHPEETVESSLLRADTALYDAKRCGKNQSRVSQK